MANPKHLKILEKGKDAWNHWRTEHSNAKPDLSGADLSGSNLIGIDLSKSNLIEVDFTGTNLTGSLLFGSDLTAANFWRANLWNTNFERAKLRWADLREANLRDAWFEKADLTEANLSGAILVGTNFEKATLQGCNVYGCSCWNVTLTKSDQRNLVIRRGSLEFSEIDDMNLYDLKDEFPGDYISELSEPAITVDNLNIAQFIYLILNNIEIRDVIDTITSKTVLILGRFTIDRKNILDAIREEIRKKGLVPILFDFDKPKDRDLAETVELLARMARFIIVDITDPSAVPVELETIVPHLRSVPVSPIVLANTKEYGMFQHLLSYPWVLKPYQYSNERDLIKKLDKMIIGPAEKKAKQLIKKNNKMRL